MWSMCPWYIERRNPFWNCVFVHHAFHAWHPMARHSVLWGQGILECDQTGLAPEWMMASPSISWSQHAFTTIYIAWPMISWPAIINAWACYKAAPIYPAGSQVCGLLGIPAVFTTQSIDGCCALCHLGRTSLTCKIILFCVHSNIFTSRFGLLQSLFTKSQNHYHYPENILFP